MARNAPRTPTHQGRRALPVLRQTATKVQTTLGDLIAAAFDTAGDAAEVGKLLVSRELRKATGRRIVLVP
jgi:hypothetical protein